MFANHRIQQTGAGTLIVATALLVAIMFLSLLSARTTIQDQKVYADNNRTQQAYEAAQAGLDYGLNYLSANGATMVSNASSGYISANTQTGTLSNGSSYSVSFSNLTSLSSSGGVIFRINSVGSSDDGTATRRLRRLIYYSPPNPLSPIPYTSVGSVTMGGNTTVQNTETNYTIWSGGNVSLSGNAATMTKFGQQSNSSGLKNDVVQNSSSLSSLTQSQFFQGVFGQTEAQVQSKATYTITNNSSTSLNSQLNNVQGAVIWINQNSGSATIDGNTVIGSATNPVILIVNGPLSISGSAKIYGLVYDVSTSVPLTGTPTIFGSVATYGGINAAGNVVINYQSAILAKANSLLNGGSSSSSSSSGTFTPITATWNDLGY